jgi:flagellar biogenesis protein FliO
MMKNTLSLILFIFIISISVVFSASFSFAAEGADAKIAETQEVYSLDAPAAAQIPSFDTKKYFIKMLISLVVVIGLVFVSILFLKKFYSTSLPSGKGKGLLRIVERFPLGPKNHLLLIWVIDRMVLVSLQNGNMQKICEIKDKAIGNDISQDLFQDSLQREMAEENAEEVNHA